MWLLSFDGAGRELTCALTKDGKIELARRLDFDDSARKSDSRQGTVSSLIPTIDELFKELDLKRSDLDAICVGIGPGGFTGVRVIVVTARTLAQVMGLGLVPVDSLETSFYDLLLTGVIADSFSMSVIVKQASRTHVYLAAYKKGENSLPQLVQAPSYMTFEIAHEHLMQARYGGAKFCLDEAVGGQLNLPDANTTILPQVKNVAATQAQLGYLRLSLSDVVERKQIAEAFPYSKVEPLYLRGASVTLKKGDVVERVESH